MPFASHKNKEIGFALPTSAPPIPSGATNGTAIANYLIKNVSAQPYSTKFFRDSYSNMIVVGEALTS